MLQKMDILGSLDVLSADTDAKINIDSLISSLDKNLE
jgi:hypothetical protein